MEPWEYLDRVISGLRPANNPKLDALAQHEAKCAAADAIPEPIRIHLSEQDWLRIQGHAEHTLDASWTDTNFEIYCHDCNKVIGYIEG